MEKRPVIGVSGPYNQEKKHTTLGEYYADTLLRAGALPVLLPRTTDEATVCALLDSIDGLLLAGGEDVHPARYGEEKIPACGAIDEIRDAFELLLVKHALERGMPIFGICRGIQVLAVALGATLFQDIESQLGLPREKHYQKEPFDDATHVVRFKEGGLLERITETSVMPTNSMHHQSIKEAGDRIRIEGITMDGIVEAISAAGNDAVFGVQFHPERFAHYSDFAYRLFTYFVEKASAYKK
ncbi:MAG: gamma-glutamyl-gamma-aminobutyrate hydrolase family protein [Clostridia bacterium]|nr:gamma-glutamyl-gamma-aminobutyrate hydrolase family protein [Clostridia bacterium]